MNTCDRSYGIPYSLLPHLRFFAVGISAHHQYIARVKRHLRHSRRIDQPYSPKLFDQPVPTALPLRRAWACGARSGRAGKRRRLNLFTDIRACGTEGEGPARRHATRHDQFVIWSSLFEQRWSIAGGRRGLMDTFSLVCSHLRNSLTVASCCLPIYTPRRCRISGVRRLGKPRGPPAGRKELPVSRLGFHIFSDQARLT